MQEDDLYDMSDEDLEAAFKAARGSSVDDVAEPSDEPVEDFQGDNDSGYEDVGDEDSGTEELADEPAGADDGDDGGEEAPEPEDEPTNAGDVEEPADTESGKEVPAPAAPTRHTFRANGQEFSFTQEEIMKNFPSVFGQAMDYTKKMQAIKPWRKTIDALESASIGQEDLNLAIEVLKGTPEAIGEVLKRHGIDPYELQTNAEEAANYVAPDHGRDAHQLAVRDVLADLHSDPDFAVTRGVLDKGGWDDTSWEFLTEDPERIRLLHQDVKSGLFRESMGEMQKLRALDRGRKPDYQYYLEAARTVIQNTQKATILEQQRQQQAAQAEAARVEQQRRTQVKEQGQRRAATTQAAAGRRAAAPAATRPKAPGPQDYLSASTEEFEDWYKSVMDNA